MKKVDIELPEWVHPARAIYVFAGIDIVARKFPNKNWEVKKTPCAMCGKCCELPDENWAIGSIPAHDPATDACKFIKRRGKEVLCSFAIDRPFACCLGDASEHDFCAIEWEEVDG